MLHLRDCRRLVKICQRREVRPRIVECVRHAEHFERVGQLQIGVDVELRHTPDELRRLRPIVVVHVGEEIGQRRFAAQQRRERRALVGQQEDHALPAAEGKLRDGVALAADIACAVLRLVHEVRALRCAVGGGEGILARGAVVKFIAPAVLEVERGEQKHHGLRLGLDVLRRVREQAAGVGVQPCLHGFVGVAGAHGGAEHGGVVVVRQPLHGLGLVGLSLAQPEGIGEQRFAVGAVGVERAPDGVRRGADGLLILRAEQVEELGARLAVHRLGEHGEGKVEVRGRVDHVRRRLAAEQLGDRLGAVAEQRGRHGLVHALAPQRLDRVGIGAGAGVKIVPQLLLRLVIGVLAHLVVVELFVGGPQLLLARLGGQLRQLDLRQRVLAQQLRAHIVRLSQLGLRPALLRLDPRAADEQQHTQQKCQILFHVVVPPWALYSFGRER